MGIGTEGLDSILLEHTQDKITIVDEDGVIKYANEAAKRLLGYDPATLIGDSAFEYIHPADEADVAATYDRVLRETEPTTETVRYRFEDVDGDWVWLESRFSNVTDERLDGYVVSSRDVTTEVIAERERASAEQRLVETADVVSDVVWMFSADWEELLFVNPAYEAVSGQSIEELRANPKTFLDQVHPGDRDCVTDAMERLSAGETVDIEYRVNPNTDYDTAVWVQAQPIIQEGEVVRIVGFIRDVTDRKRRERQLAVMDNLLRHNLRNDLSLMLGHAELIIQDGDSTSAGRAEVIRKQGQDLLETAEKQRTIIDLLTDSQPPEPIEVEPLLDQIVEIIRTEHPELHIETECSGAPTIIARQEIGAGIVELVENAVDHYEGDDPTVSITVAETDSRVLIRCRDSCPPIPEAEYRVLTGDREMNRVYHSSGLGLWLVYWAVDLSDGQISFERHEDGNTITISLPRARPEG